MPIELSVSDATIWSTIVYLFKPALFTLIFVLHKDALFCKWLHVFHALMLL